MFDSRMKILTVGLLGWFLLTVGIYGQSPIGSDFQINTYTSGEQKVPEVAIGPTGDFVVVWQSDGDANGDGAASSIQGQRYSSTGTQLGPQFLVNSYTPFGQRYPAIAMDAEGDFVVVWASDGSDNGDTDSYSIQGQRYASDGLVLGSQFLVNSYTSSFQGGAAVSAAANGDFVVAWGSNGSDNGDYSLQSIQAQRFASTGLTQGGQFRVNSYVDGLQIQPDLAHGPDGEFVVVWLSGGSDGDDSDGYSVQGQRFASDGGPVASEFQVNTATTGAQLYPAVTADSTGNFTVVWDTGASEGGDDQPQSIQGQRFSSAGMTLGSQFLVNAYTTGAQVLPEIVTSPEGGFLVVWQSEGSGGDDTSLVSVQGRRFLADGSPREQFQLNSYTLGDQVFPEVGVNPQGDLVVTWFGDSSSGTDTDLSSIQARLFQLSLFDDGFESGTTDAWSDTTP